MFSWRTGFFNTDIDFKLFLSWYRSLKCSGGWTTMPLFFPDVLRARLRLPDLQKRHQGPSSGSVRNSGVLAALPGTGLPADSDPDTGQY
jgi:hypothetical protein